MAQTYANNDDVIIIDLEKNIQSLTKGVASSHYYNSLFKKMSLINLQNATILYEFLQYKHNIQNVKSSTISLHIKAICLFNKYLGYKDFEKITKENIITYLSSLKKKRIRRS